MQTRKVAVIIFYDEKGRVLLQDRKGISKFGEEWGYFGGQIEEGETPEQAIKREIKEELEFKLEEFVFLGTYKYTVRKLNIRVELNLFASPLPDMSKLVLREGNGMKVFELEEARKLKFVAVKDRSMLKVFEKWFNKMSEQKVWFKNSKGMKLCGLIALQAKKSPVLILVHGTMPRTDKHEYGFYDKISKELFKAGYSIFRFDFHAHGESEGNYIDVRVKQEADDLKCAIDFLFKKYSDEIDSKNIGILATSFGAIPTVFLNDQRVKALLLSCPGVRMDKSNYVFDNNLYPTWKEEFEKNGFARLNRKKEVEERKRKIGAGLYKDIISSEVFDKIKKLNKPVFIIGAGKDEYVNPEDVKELFEAANEPKQLKIVDFAYHGFSESKKEIEIFLEEAKNWFNKWLFNKGTENMNMIKLIINADDFGLSRVFNEKMLELLERGFIKSTTVMVNRVDEGQKSQIDELKKLKETKKISVGLHFDFNIEQPIEPQMEQQYSKFISIFGFLPSHVDIHKFVDVRRIIMKVNEFAEAHNLPVRNHGIKADVKQTTQIIMYDFVSNWTTGLDAIISSLQNMEDGSSCELCTHPGAYDPECKSSRNKERQEDYNNIIKLHNFLNSHKNIKLISYFEL